MHTHFRNLTLQRFLPAAAQIRRIPIYFNWDPREDPRSITRRLLDRHPDLKKANAEYSKLDTRKADDYVELFSRQVSTLISIATCFVL